MMENKTSKIIKNPGCARHLLRAGFKIVDIKKDKEDPTGKKSVFVFERTPEFDAAFAEINDQIKKSKDEEML